MSNKKITNVLLKKNNSIQRIPLDKMTKKMYKENKKYIFCPNQFCDANIDYCEGQKMIYYRTRRSIVNGETIIEQHIDGCPFGIEHSAISTPKTIYDDSVGYLISSKHIQDSLRRAYKQHTDAESGKPKKSTSTKKNKKTPISTKNEETTIRGRGILGKQDHEELESSREPNLYQKSINEIKERDYGKSRLVKGFITSIKYEYDSITIILDTTNDIRGRIYFSESFKVENSQQFGQMKHYQTYVNHQNNNGNKVFIACAGDVKKDDFGVSIHVKSYEHIMIDGMMHYPLLKNLESI